MKTSSQNNWVVNRLTRYGRVTRNQALSQKPPITRLASRILDVKPVFEDKGQEIFASRLKTNAGVDYEYRLTDKDCG